MQVFHYLAEELKEEPLFSDDEESAILQDDPEYGEGAIYNDFSDRTLQLLSSEDIREMELSSQTCSQSRSTAFDPYDNFTKEDRYEAVKAASEIDPDYYSIDHRLQITTGPTSSQDYLKSVMLMIASNLRILQLTHAQEMHLQVLADRKSPEPNAALDAWILLHGKRRKEFDVNLLIFTYPGMKKYIGQNEHSIEDNRADNGDEDGSGDEGYDGDHTDDDKDDVDDDNNGDDAQEGDDGDHTDDDKDDVDDDNDGDNDQRGSDDTDDDNDGVDPSDNDDDFDDDDDDDSESQAPQPHKPTSAWIKFTSWLKPLH